MKNVINIKSVTFGYPKKEKIFQDFSVDFSQNEITGIIGKNGSGKTTLGKLTCGILKPSGGEILAWGKQIKEMTLGEIGSNIGYLYQSPERQLFALSVFDELAFTLELDGVSKDEINKRVEQQLEEYELLHLKTHKPFTLSRGEKQRLAIAAILMRTPKMLVLDEPTTSLDYIRKSMLGTTLEKLRNKGIGVVIISHDMEFISLHANRIIEIENGRLKRDEYK
jgi:energy-coupling factor transport system ATP-binding protein